jgi:Ca-activated chloride channel family protein
MRLRLAFGLVLGLLLAASWFWSHTARAAQDAPRVKVTQGVLLAGDAEGKPLGELPLKRTDVKAEISGFIARVTVTQEFDNQFSQPVEAVYSFPLPQDAAVDDMTMQVGGRKIKGRVMRREEARKTYEEAKARGSVASLLDQERPNIFTQSVANIPPFQPARVVISYVETLRYEAGSYEFTFPMTVGPRYTPAGATAPDTNAGVRPGNISLEINIDAGVPLESVASGTHEIETLTANSRANVRLKSAGEIPNRDFTLKYDVAGRAVSDALLTHRDERGGFFTFILQPPDRVDAAEATPKELVFVVDTSGSMQGFPLDKAKETAAIALANLNPQDTFNVITFSGEDRVLFPAPVPATKTNVKKAQDFLAGSQSGGGTEMMKAIKTALDPTDAQSHIRIACFMTDGQVGNDFGIISEVQKHPNARVFALGFGDSPNRFLLDQMALHGRGAVEYVTGPDEKDAKDLARRFYERVRNPLLTDLQIDWNGLPVADVYPQRLPDLFGAQPVAVAGRFTGAASGAIRLTGKRAGQPFSREIAVNFPDTQPAHDTLATLWARRRVADLMAQDFNGLQNGNPKPEIKDAITNLGLEFRLLTQFTSFVAVDENTGQNAAIPKPTGVEVGADDVVSISGSRALYSMAATVEVTNGASVIETTSATVSNNIEARSVQTLPTRARDVNSLATLAPGVATARSGNGLDTGAVNQVSTNGQPPTANQFTVDGASANIALTPGAHPGASVAGVGLGRAAAGSAAAVVTTEGASEVSITANSFKPEMGRTFGGNFAVTTKAGTNEFHGSLFEQFGNDKLDANDWFANSRALPRAPRRHNLFGGTVGGPLRRDKAFFFFAYEGLRLRQPFSALTDAPSLAARQTVPLLQAFPLPNRPARPDGFTEFAASYANPARHDAASLRLDQRIGDKLSLNGRYNYAASSATERGAGAYSLNTLNRTTNQTQTLTVQADYTATSKLVINGRGNFSRVRTGSAYSLDEFGGALALGITRPNSFSLFDLNGRNAAFAIGAEVNGRQRQLQLQGEVAYIRGNHALKFGADWRRLAPVVGVYATERATLYDGVNGALANNIARLNFWQRDAAGQRPRYHNFSLSGQDEWRITQRLTATYGLRWEINPAPSAETPNAPLWATAYGNIAPRAGLAWDLTGSGKSVLRGGFAVLYDTGHAPTGEFWTESAPFVTGNVSFNVQPGVAILNPAAPLLTYDPRSRLPFVRQWHTGFERQIGGPQKISATYLRLDGRRLPIVATTSSPTVLLRAWRNEGRSSYDALQLNFMRQPYSDKLLVMASYTLARGRDDAPQDTTARALFRSANERGPSDFDVRHTLNGLFAYTFPAPFKNGWANKLSRKWELLGLFNARSARALNVVYGLPTIYGWLYLRPDVTNAPLYVTENGPRRVNPAAFTAPASLRQGTLERNTLRGFPLYQLDLALSRQFKFTDARSLELRADVANVLNRANFADPAGYDLSVGHRFAPNALTPNLTFGQSSAVAGRAFAGGPGRSFNALHQPGGPRSLQLAARLRF